VRGVSEKHMRRELTSMTTCLDGVFDFDGGFGRLDGLVHLASKLFGVQCHSVGYRFWYRLVILEDCEMWMQVGTINKLEAYR